MTGCCSKGGYVCSTDLPLGPVGGALVNGARLVGGLVLPAMGVVPRVVLDPVDSGMASAAVSHLVLGACVVLLVGASRARSS
jgi:hypothetical protein